MNPKYELGDEIKCNINTWMKDSNWINVLHMDECL
jgi:hypothetical protein